MASLSPDKQSHAPSPVVKSEADLAQIAALLLIVPALRKFGGRAGIDVGEEIGAVVDQGAEIQLEPLDEALGDLFFAFEDVFGGVDHRRRPGQTLSPDK
jgi:hypothetical protein